MSAEEREPITWALSPEEFAATKERAARINERAIKRGFTGRIEVTGTPREITETDEAGLQRTRIVVDTHIEGEAPRYGGWEFLAAVDSIETETETGPGFVVRTAPGIDESGVDRDTLAPGRCEHCNTARANRRYTYLVRNTETGQTLQVGKTCIKDFTGWKGTPVFFYADELADDLTGFIGGFSGAPTYTPETIVAVAWAVSRRYGWAPASAISKTPTRTLVSSYLFGRSKADQELRAEIATEIASATATAKQIIPTLLDGLEGGSDYVTNLKTCLRATHVESRHMGIVVSAVSAYERLIGDREQREIARARREAEAAERAAKSATIDYAGEVGEKITLTGTITHLVPIQGDYGVTMLIVVENVTTAAKMFTAAAWASDVKQGDEITLTGTVKTHEEYQGIKQTVLTRPKQILGEDRKKD